MARTLIINSTPYSIPDAGDEPGWGGDTSDWMEAVTNSLGDLVGPADILETSFTLANNQSSFIDITGLVFDGGSVRSAVVNYSIYRISDSNPSGFAESGTLTLIYDNNASLPWSMSQGDIVGNSQVYFDITISGQIRYKTNDIGSLNYIGVMKFSAQSQIQ
jgi:hypothetical protein